ncbi:DUF969 domain-containing protein [Bacillus smithii]|jgi:uncharacterized membrane protein|uniref:DUF969 domain-containing protein n=1 Tax=Bacillus smithii TaxID=1479 RepID=UPI002E1E8D25|nr:DUF969 domain-containing protein [Bacillus smithii]
MVLIGVALIIVGFLFRINPLVVVTVSGLVTGLIAGIPFKDLIAQFGEAFTTNRYMSILIITLPVIGLMERSGLQKQSALLVSKIKAITAGRLINIYFLIREIGAALGLNSIGGHPQTVRPLIAPMAEGAAEAKYGKLPKEERENIRAHAAAADNIGLFFGEDIFVAVGGILLMKGFFDQNHVVSDPVLMALWGIPTAVGVFIIHSIRLYLFDRRLERRLGQKKPENKEVKSS